MQQLVAPDAVERMMLFIGVIGPIAGLIIGIMLGAHERCVYPKMVSGVLIGGVGTLVYGMWRAYNAITNALGLDSVANLVLQLVMFVLLGVVIGFAIPRISSLMKRLWARY